MATTKEELYTVRKVVNANVSKEEEGLFVERLVVEGISLPDRFHRGESVLVTIVTERAIGGR